MATQPILSRPRPAPAPFVIEPTAPHTHTFILLHGLGSNGEKFGRELLETGIGSDGLDLPSRFPGAKFIFPTSRRRRSTAFRRSMLTQWFDIASPDDLSDRSHKQLAGLRESFAEILAIVEAQADCGVDAGIPRQNIVLGGLSQGCAMALICLIALERPIGRFVGMSGWLPFQKEIEARAGAGAAAVDRSELESVLLGGANTAKYGPHRSLANGIDYVRELLQLENVVSDGTHAILSTPVFLGHGTADDKVKISLGEAAQYTMCRLGFDVAWKAYAEQGHWYKIPDEIDDIVAFVSTKCRWIGDKQPDMSGNSEA
ncbi:phospholipase/carboxylesterase [Sporothrix brasiliensis 5110]|uniref:Phospholipase/carboxylesterase n=1 Tax=Sporothrix brasiliensis 5110 TaxID=1398154 RepID=A0A0C2IYN2_9PEZI|nr:phospholipase/carboxylesterase [Sporothrix brasiliensis 5110]KIH94166.1 phospholipase/carboxylesterase [Sporothrix brasiliensis 5110]